MPCSTPQTEFKHSGPLSVWGGGFCFFGGGERCSPQYAPLHIGPEFFTPNTGQCLNGWAVLSRHTVDAPLLHNCMRLHTNPTGKGCDTPRKVDCTVEAGFDLMVHGPGL